MRWCIEPGPSQLFGRERGCAEFEQRLLRLDGPTPEHANADEDEVLYVVSGTGRAAIGGEAVELAPGIAAYVPHGTGWRVEAADELEILSVLVREPLPAAAAGPVVVDAAVVVVAGATAGRQFRLLVRPEVGCATVTQFLGYIPVGRAPDHFHRYDEVMYVLAGEGALHMDGETAPLRRGTAVHFPARLVHCVENFGPDQMEVLGVFRPAGSPAEAYYPDGTPAVVAAAG
jgi:mannose-6-phosphate isomerase-like protein (cupin superfamily)